MNSTLKHVHEGRHGTGITLHAFRLNTAANHIMFTGRRGRVYERIVLLSGVRPGDAVLDVGSSSGYLTHRLAAVAGQSGRVTGVDPSEPAIASARRHARPGTTFTVGVAQDLDLPDSAFDVVTCTLAMHHIPARQRGIAFAELYRVTKPGGRLLTADMTSLLHGGDRRSGDRRGGDRRSGEQRMRQAAAAVGPLADLAIAAGYQIESTGKLPLLGYIVAIRPRTSPA